jgi:hypothetical protein
MPENMEEAVRAMLRDHVERLGKVLLTPECHQMLDSEIRQRIALLEFVKREAALEERSPEYAGFVEHLTMTLAESQLGPLNRIKPEQLQTLEALLNSLLVGLAGQAPQESLDGRALIDLQRKVFIEPKKRGPKPDPHFDAAYERYKLGESPSEIARDLEPQAYKVDTWTTLQRYTRAFKRRDDQAAGT